MSSVRCYILLSIVCLLEGKATEKAGQNWENKVDEEGRSVQSLKIQAPSMTEEDQYGYTMPDQYRCDACKVVAHHLGEALTKRQVKNRRLLEWEYTDLFDDTCKKGFPGYGIALVGGQNVLSGPALKRQDVEPGEGSIQMGGETWEKRLGEICRKFVYDKIGEDELYDHFRSHGGVSSDLCFSETRDCELGPQAPHKERKTSKGKKDATAKQGNSAARADSKRPVDMDLSTFIEKLAKKHGVAKSAYTRKRSFSDWELMLTKAAQQISGQNSEAAFQSIEV